MSIPNDIDELYNSRNEINITLAKIQTSLTGTTGNNGIIGEIKELKNELKSVKEANLKLLTMIKIYSGLFILAIPVIFNYFWNLMR